MVIDELGEYLVLRGFSELDSTRFKKRNTLVYLGVRGGHDNFKITESGEQIAVGTGISQLVRMIK